VVHEVPYRKLLRGAFGGGRGVEGRCGRVRHVNLGDVVRDSRLFFPIRKFIMSGAIGNIDVFARLIVLEFLDVWVAYFQNSGS
jgi:hypothetical protein